MLAKDARWVLLDEHCVKSLKAHSKRWLPNLGLRFESTSLGASNPANAAID